jgi:hypothetical protein
MIENIKLKILSVFTGIFMKLYDDLNDNDLYTYFNIKNKELVNEILKGVVYISFTTLSLNYEIFYFMIVFILSVNAYFDRAAYLGSYELGGLISIYFIFLLINYSKININYKDFLFSGVLLVGAIVFDFGKKIQVEFSKNKLVLRAFSVIFLSIVLLLNYYFNFFSENSDILSLWILGYMATSCIFQSFLIYNKKNEPVEKVLEEHLQEIQSEEPKLEENSGSPLI